MNHQVHIDLKLAYGLTDITAVFKNSAQHTYQLSKYVFFLDDITVVSTGPKFDRINNVNKCVKNLNDDNLSFNRQNCHFAKSEIERLDYKFTQTVILSIESQTAAILAVLPSNTRISLPSFLGSVHYISKIIQYPAQFCRPLRPLTKKSAKFVFTESHPKHFNTIEGKIAQTTENCHNSKLDFRVKYDASFSELGVAPEQNTREGGNPLQLSPIF